MILIFGRNDHWISRLIQLRTWEQWSHVGIVIEGKVLESKGVPVAEYIKHKLLGHELFSQHGVDWCSIDDFKARYVETDMRWVPGDAERALALHGMPFDMGALFGSFCHQPWEDPDEYNCAELAFHALFFTDNKYAHKVAPAHLYWFSLPLVEGKPCFTA